VKHHSATQHKLKCRKHYSLFYYNKKPIGVISVITQPLLHVMLLFYHPPVIILFPNALRPIKCKKLPFYNDVQVPSLVTRVKWQELISSTL